MQRIQVHRIARRSGPCAQQLRHNSSAPSKPSDGESPSPATPSSQPRVSSYHGLVIPTREEALKNPNVYMAYKPFADSSKSFRPSLSYLTKGGSSGFAQRLAQQQMQGRNQKSNSDPRTRNDRWKRPAQSDSAKDVQASGEAKPQSDAPSERTQGQRPPPRSRPQQQAQDGRASSERGASQNTRPQRSNRDQPSGMPSQARPRERFDGTDVSTTAQRPRNNQRERRPQSKAVSGSDTQAQRPRNRRKKQPRPDSKQPVVFKSVKPVEGTLEDGETGARDVDDWDPDETPPLPPNPAGISTPDVQISQLSSIASPPSTRSQILALSTSTSLKFGGLSVPLEHKQWARETLGGDYSQFAPQSSKDFITSHVELGPLKHSQLVLSHRPDVSLSQRKIVGGIVQASVTPP